jgi:hypothetical protein
LTLFLVWRLALAAGQHSPPPRIALLAPLILACNGAFACWSLSGMETMLYLCLIAGSFLTVFTERHRWSAALVIATLYTRPEGFLILLILTLYQFLNLANRPRAGGVVGGMRGAIRRSSWPGISTMASGANTYYARGRRIRAYRGGGIFPAICPTTQGPILLFLIPLYAILQGGQKQRFLALGAAAGWAFTIAVGGDGLPLYRFALPALPLLAILETHVVADLGRASRQLASGQWRLEALGAALALAIVGVHAPRSVHGPHYELYEYQRQIEIPVDRVGKWLRENARPTVASPHCPLERSPITHA